MKAIAYGIPGIYVDGNDVFAMLTASQKAVSYARETGPILLEAYTYRMGAHTTSDDPTKYRTDDDVEPWKEKDPILRLERYMLAEGLLKEDEIEPMIEKMKEEVMDAYRSIENSSDTELEDIFKYQYAEMTPQLTEQLEEYRAFWKERSRMANSINNVQAVQQALQNEMALDPTVVVYGEDVGYEGGVFRATVGLQEEFGKAARLTPRWPNPLL